MQQQYHDIEGVHFPSLLRDVVPHWKFFTSRAKRLRGSTVPGEARLPRPFFSVQRLSPGAASLALD